MVHCKFRILRKSWMGLSAILSFATIALTLSLRPHITHTTHLVVLIGIPSLAVLGTLWTIFRNILTRGRSPQRVSVEATWTFALLPFEFVLGLLSTNVLSQYDNPQVTRSLVALQAIVWANCGVVSIYIIALLLLSAVTQLAFDAEVWTRDIDSNPSPFPMSVVLPYALPFTARFFPPSTPTPSTLANTRTVVGHTYCLPGCTCSRKLLPPFAPPAHTLYAISRSSYAGSDTPGGSTPAVIPVRLPTDMERRRSIIVAFDGLGSRLGSGPT